MWGYIELGMKCKCIFTNPNLRSGQTGEVIMQNKLFHLINHFCITLGKDLPLKHCKHFMNFMYCSDFAILKKT